MREISIAELTQAMKDAVPVALENREFAEDVSDWHRVAYSLRQRDARAILDLSKAIACCYGEADPCKDCAKILKAAREFHGLSVSDSPS